jgi:carbonic anhydrase
MTSNIQLLIDNNRAWAAQMVQQRPNFFSDLAQQQTPKYLWIGCSDSRVPANQITGLDPGEVFVHRNVANIVATNDWNLSAVLEFSINHLHIPDIVVCGHYGCGGILALDRDFSDDRYIPIWLINAQKAAIRVDRRLEAGLGEVEPEIRHRLIVDENVRLQLEHLQEYPFVAAALKAKRLRLHGWVYDMASGAIRIVSSPDDTA